MYQEFLDSGVGLLCRFMRGDLLLAESLASHTPQSHVVCATPAVQAGLPAKMQRAENISVAVQVADRGWITTDRQFQYLQSFEVAQKAYAFEQASLPVPRHSQLSRVPKPSLLRRCPEIAITPGVPMIWKSPRPPATFSRPGRLDEPPGGVYETGRHRRHAETAAPLPGVPPSTARQASSTKLA